MISSISLTGEPCFDPEGIDVALRTNTFFYGPNGSGKTTISRIFESADPFLGSLKWKTGTSPLSVRVYNREYVEKTLASSNNLPGVFLLGENSDEVVKRIQELEGPKGEIAKAKNKFSRNEQQLGNTSEKTGLLGEMAEALTALQESAWKQKKLLPAEFTTIFRGYNSEKAKFTQRILEIYSEEPAASATNTDSIESICEVAASVFNDAAKPIQPIEDFRTPSLPTTDLAEILVKPTVGSNSVDIAGMLEQLGHDGWVRSGRQYLEDTDGLCPFCQQKLPVGFTEKIELFFDQTYEKNISSIRHYREQYKVELEKIRQRVREILQSPPQYLNIEEFAALWSKADGLFVSNEAILEKKIASPALSIELTDTTTIFSEIMSTINFSNGKIEEHNNRIKNKKQAQVQITAKGWSHFVFSIMKGEVAAFTRENTLRVSKADGLKNQIEREKARATQLASDLRELQRKSTSSEEAVYQINQTLQTSGFHRFKLQAAEEKEGGYTLVRPDGTLASESLSEGERTLITFLYFYHHLKGIPTNANDSNGLVVVVDDPISSLDSDVMFLITSLVRDIAIRAAARADKVVQLVVLTHNTHFYKEVVYDRGGDKLGSKQFAIIKKSSGGHSTIECFDKNPIKSAYEYLWSAVRDAESNPQDLPITVGLENILRRILENYFKVMGDVDDDEIIARFPQYEQVVCRSMFSWINAGSHAIVEDFEHSPSQVSTRLYLDIFKKIFEVSGHPGHYNMMMRVETLPQSVVAPAESAVG